MSTTSLYIPERINVGFRRREDTYTKKLAYVIYYDHKGKLRKETSWNGWRDKSINSAEFKNEPTEGFVLNKGVGGARQSYGWNTRNEYIRVYDPRDFEFEISVSNLLFILRESVCNKGKGLEGKFTYAWDGTELVLLPENSVDYQESKKHTALQASKVSAKELIIGATYQTKNKTKITYLGRFEYNRIATSEATAKVSKKHVFWAGKQFQVMDSLSSVANLESDVVPANYADLVDKYNKTAHGSRPVKLYLAPRGLQRAYYRDWYREIDGKFEKCTQVHSYNRTGSEVQKRYFLKDGVIVGEDMTTTTVKSRYDYRSNGYPTTSEKSTNMGLFADLENGMTIEVSNDRLEVVHKKPVLV